MTDTKTSVLCRFGWHQWKYIDAYLDVTVHVGNGRTYKEQHQYRTCVKCNKKHHKAIVGATG